MWRGTFLFLCFGLAIAIVGASPNAESLETLYKTALSGSRISDNVQEDARLDVPDLIRKYNYPIEVHNVTTEDGYILEIHRIPHGRDNNNDPNVRRPVVFLMHGLLCSSADWVLMGPGDGFAYLLAEAGFDVWMGNARGNYYSRRHVRLNPNAIFNTRFWEFSWDEIGNIDLPTMIDYALEITGRDRLHYVGHSQGTTSFFVMGSLRPEYNDKIISMHAFAPVAYMAHNRNPLLLVLAPFSNNLESLGALIGLGEFLPNSIILTWAGQSFCLDEVVFQPICSNILFLIGGWSESQQNTTMLPVKFGHTPAGVSVRQLAHYGQGIADKGFRRYDHGSRRANRRAYGTRRPPAYDLSKVTAPVFLHYVDKDPLAHVNDVDRLFRELGRPVGKFRVPLRTFSHLDFLWGIDAQELVYDRTINLIRSLETNGLDEEILTNTEQ
ncbi:lipase 3-like [Galleria mellonella]|uniref:Lipase n=1 Tax=Galleria mellonella TaxID=7137 RepID=A0ABM3MUH2_GALME|nr:lipase 3-like [Galleria mellonella]